MPAGLCDDADGGDRDFWFRLGKCDSNMKLQNEKGGQKMKNRVLLLTKLLSGIGLAAVAATPAQAGLTNVNMVTSSAGRTAAIIAARFGFELRYLC